MNILDKFYTRLLRVYHKLGNSLSASLINKLSLLGIVIISLQMTLENMDFLFLISDGISILRPLKGFIWEFTFAIGLFLAFLPVFREPVVTEAPRSINKWLFIPWLGYAFFWGLSSFTAGFGRAKLVLIALFIVIPIFWQSRAYQHFEKLLRRYLYTNVFIAVLYYCSAFLWMPYLGQRYPALSFNPNSLGAIALYFATCFVILLVHERNHEKLIFLNICIGFTLGCIILTGTRTSLIVFVALSAASLILSLRDWEKGKLFLNLLQIAAILFIACGTIFLFNVRSNNVNYLNVNYPPNNPYFNTISSLDRGEKKLFYQTVVRRNEEEDAFKKDYFERFKEDDANVDKALNGRMKIWHDYALQLKILGQHELDKKVKQELGLPFNAHNIWLQLAYDGGILCSLCFLFYILVCIGKSLKIFVRGKISFLEYAFVITLVPYLIRGLVEASYSFMYYNVAFLQLLTVLPFMHKKLSGRSPKYKDK